MVWVRRIDVDKAKGSWSEGVSLVANDIIVVLPAADGARLVTHSAFSALGSTTWKETITVTTSAP
jgi:hypothetical protein